MNKKSLSLMSAITIGILLFFASCGGGTPKEDNSKKSEAVEEATETATEEATESADVDEKHAAGKKIYDTKCVVCHQADAKGLPGAFPPLAESDYLLKDPKRGIHQTLNGSHEEMIVNGQTYNAPMTPQVETKEEALAVINYVINNFGNSWGELTMDDIKDVKIAPRDK
jgi:nitrite reductase (NO-forming)